MSEDSIFVAKIEQYYLRSHYWFQKLLTFLKTQCLRLTYTVKTLYHTVQDTDILYCTLLCITVRFYWLVLYSTKQHYMFWLTRTDGYTDTHCAQLYSTERGCIHTLYTLVQYSTHYDCILFYFLFFLLIKSI